MTNTIVFPPSPPVPLLYNSLKFTFLPCSSKTASPLACLIDSAFGGVDGLNIEAGEAVLEGLALLLFSIVISGLLVRGVFTTCLE